ncbi:MAG: TOMM precursor leader peptide-binding protein [Acidimicrobiales bacterium]
MTSLPRRPLLVGMYHVVALGDDRVQVATAGRSVVIGGLGARATVRFLDALDGTATTAELETRFPEMAPDLLDALCQAALLTDGEGSDHDERQVATALVVSPAEVADRLRPATVAVVGCGPVGGAAAVLLARAGVGHLLLLDTDVRRPAIRPARPVGLWPAEELVGLCRDAGSAAALSRGPAATHAPTSTSAWSGADLAVVALGYEHRDAGPGPADLCLARGQPYLVHSQDALDAVVGPLVRPGGVPCHRCVEQRLESHRDHPKEHLAYRRQRAGVAPGLDAFLGAHVAVVAGLVATEALRGLLVEPGPTAGGVLVVDLDRLSVVREPVLAVPGCRACAAAAGLGPASGRSGPGPRSGGRSGPDHKAPHLGFD